VLRRPICSFENSKERSGGLERAVTECEKFLSSGKQIANPWSLLLSTKNLYKSNSTIYAVAMDQLRPAATKDSSNLDMIGPLHPTFYIAQEILARTQEVRVI